MVILGLDIAITTGIAIYDTNMPLSDIETGILQARGVGIEEKAASLGELLYMELTEGRKIDCVVWERAMRIAIGGNGSKAFAMANALTGAVSAVCAILDIHHMQVSPQSWRKSFLGKGSDKSMKRADWKRAAVQRCELLKIKAYGGHDAAEAVGIAYYGACELLKGG